MKILSVVKGLKTRRYAFKLTPEEFSRLDILAKEAGVTKDEWLEDVIEAHWAAKDIKAAIERYLNEEGKPDER